MTASAGKVLVFGAAGHIGGPLARFLRYKGWGDRLLLATSSPAKLDQLKTAFPGSEAIVADYLAPASLVAACRDAEYIFVITPDFIDELAAMANLVQAARRAPRLRQILRILGDPPHMSIKKVPQIVRDFGRGTAIQHLQARDVLEQSDLPITYLNIASYLMDDFIRWNGTMKSDRALAMPFERRTTWIDPGELGEAAARIILQEDDRHLHQLYHLNNGSDHLFFSEIAEVISDVLQQRIVHDDAVAFWQQHMGHRYVSLFGQGADEYFKAYYEFEQTYQFAFHRSDVLERLLGRQPKTLRAWVEQNAHLLL
ncbi:SDR family oxidoreductase [Sphingopyxis sp. MSC1_008]|jgi:uncharacterized protein YbjT (DUF2867 family)|uniref:SDR family oxidoreductase n=1 Tax=Sphingopyxis sp. MSC1_008 TaxID=2909265 RepID=UPI0020BE91FF|nr:NmrA family NAD(P)-binding protein [Sphingopyxis sp. MSC1_008]